MGLKTEQIFFLCVVFFFGNNAAVEKLLVFLEFIGSVFGLFPDVLYFAGCNQETHNANCENQSTFNVETPTGKICIVTMRTKRS